MIKFVLVLGVFAVVISFGHCGDYFEIGDNVYFMSYPLVRNWHAAGRYCTFHNMYLLDLNTEAENTIAKQVLDAARSKLNFTSGLVWTSGTDLGSEGQYYWEISGWPMLYTNWKINQPDNAGKNEHCIEIQVPGYYWNDRPCTTESSFICQKYKRRSPAPYCQSEL